MKLNPDCVREILLFLEETLDYVDADSEYPHEHRKIPFNGFSGGERFRKFTSQEIAYATEVLYKEGYIECVNVTMSADNSDILFANISSITWKGHELIESIQNEKVWMLIKKKIKETVGTASINVIASSAKWFMNGMMTDSNFLETFKATIENAKILLN